MSIFKFKEDFRHMNEKESKKKYINSESSEEISLKK